MKPAELDQALAAFHDASLHALSVDWLNREAVIRVLTNDDDRPRELLLVAIGLSWFTMDPPTLNASRGYNYAPSGGPMIDVNVGLHGPGAPTNLASSAAMTVTVFVADWNSFIWIGATTFEVREAT